MTSKAPNVKPSIRCKQTAESFLNIDNACRRFALSGSPSGFNFILKTYGEPRSWRVETEFSRKNSVFRKVGSRLRWSRAKAQPTMQGVDWHNFTGESLSAGIGITIDEKNRKGFISGNKLCKII